VILIFFYKPKTNIKYDSVESTGRPSMILGNIHIYKICFSFFEPFHLILALKLAKNVNISKTKLFL